MEIAVEERFQWYCGLISVELTLRMVSIADQQVFAQTGCKLSLKYLAWSLAED